MRVRIPELDHIKRQDKNKHKALSCLINIPL